MSRAVLSDLFATRVLALLGTTLLTSRTNLSVESASPLAIVSVNNNSGHGVFVLSVEQYRTILLISAQLTRTTG